MASDLPWQPLISPYWLFGALVIFLVVFHWALLWQWKLDKRGWKCVDYIWLAVGTLALVNWASDARSLLATSRLSLARTYLEATQDRLRERMQIFSTGAVCRQFTRSELSPPSFDAVQREYDLACSWGMTTSPKLLMAPPEKFSEIALAGFPTVEDAVLKNMAASARLAETEMRKAQQALEGLQAAAERSDRNPWFRILSPLLFVIAIALRITKVTGELRLGA